MDEIERRELAEQHKDEIAEIVGPVEPRSLDQIMSVRMPGDLAADLRDVAVRAGVSVSDLLRAAARQLVAGEPVIAPRRPRGWTCQHYTITSVPGVVSSVSVDCGCRMQPIAS